MLNLFEQGGLNIAALISYYFNKNNVTLEDKNLDIK